MGKTGKRIRKAKPAAVEAEAVEAIAEAQPAIEEAEQAIVAVERESQPARRMSGLELKALLRQQRRDRRQAERGY